MTRWTGKGDARHWADAANWTDGVPAAGIDARFATGATESVRLSPGTALSAGALLVSADTLTLSAGGLNLAPMQAQSGNTFDMVLDDNAHLTVAAGARLAGTNVAEIGDGTGATLTLLGTVAEEFGVVSDGTLDVAGPHGHWLSGASGLFFDTASLVVEAGARIDTLAQDPASLIIDGDSTALVTGAGSVVRLSDVFVSSDSGTSTFTVQDGGAVFTGGGAIGGNGDGTLTVTGAGSVFSASRGLSIGGQVPVNSRLLVENGGSVRIGRFGLSLDGTLAIDGASSFTAPDILSGGGVIQALSGTVDLQADLHVYFNTSDRFETETTYLDAGPGATLQIAGAVSSADPGDTSVVLDAASGHVVLSHDNQGFAGTTEIYAATLEIAAKGAAGAGGLSFIGGAQAATLKIDAGLPFHNLITGFTAADTIDLAAFGYDHVHVGFAATAGGGTVTLTNADHQTQSLHFGGTGLSAMSFTATPDGQGGTALIHT